MNIDDGRAGPVGRRTFLRRGLAAATVVGLGLGAVPGTVAAMNKAELIEAMASESRLSKADSKRALDAMVGTATGALKKGDRISLVGFGTLTPPSGHRSDSPRDGNIGPRRRAPVDEFQFAPDEALVGALNLVPGGHHRGATQRACPDEGDGHHGAGETAGRADERCVVVVDAAGVARDSGLSKADAKRALEGFVSATTRALKKGDRISLVGFGSFSISKRSARTGRNPQTGKARGGPQTGKEIQIAAKNVVRFEPDPELTNVRGTR